MLTRNLFDAFNRRHVKWLRASLRFIFRNYIVLPLPCQRLPDRIQEASYHRWMKMSEFWRSCLDSCGTSAVGFLRKSSVRVLGP